MKKTVLALLCFLLSAQLYAQDKIYTIGDIPNVQLRDSRRFVSNPDDILSESAVHRIDTMLYNLKQSGKAQVAVITVNSIGYEDPTDFLFSLMEAWGVGDKNTDNGLGVLLVIDQGAIEILTGYGLEGDLPDAILKRVIENYMIPYFKERDWDNGMAAGIEVIADILDGRVPEDVSNAGDSTGWWFVVLFVGLFFLFPVGLVTLIVIFQTRCPKCKKLKLRRVSSRVILKTAKKKVEEVTYKCRNCGNVVVRNVTHHYGGGSGSFGGGGGSFGGGSSGGSWGGGSFGGGGARGRF